MKFGVSVLTLDTLRALNFCDFWSSGPLFKATAEKFGMRVQSWKTLLHAKFGKNPLRGHTPLGQIVTKKIPILAILGVYA